VDSTGSPATGRSARRHGPAPAASAAELRAGWRALVSAGVPFERWLPVLNRVVRAGLTTPASS
jgi:hypothetical protein